MLSEKMRVTSRKIIAAQAASAATKLATDRASWFKDKLEEKGKTYSREEKIHLLHTCLSDTFLLIDNELLKSIREHYKELWELAPV